MPELPEVETMRRGMAPAVGARILAVRFPRSHLKPISVSPSRPQLRRRLVGRTILEVGRFGKRIVFHLDQALHLVIEPRMTGLMLVADPPDVEHLRVGWFLADSAVDALWFWDRRGLGTVSMMTDEQLTQSLGPDRLGPDAIQLSAELLRQRLCRSRRAIKVALLDQTAVAGIGNLYASEILHVAQIHPSRPCTQLTRRQWQQLHDAMQSVLTEAIRYEGSTLADGTYRNALNRQGEYQNHHRVYMRHGEPCLRCRTTSIRRMVQAQRSSFWCPTCQRR